MLQQVSISLKYFCFEHLVAYIILFILKYPQYPVSQNLWANLFQIWILDKLGQNIYSLKRSRNIYIALIAHILPIISS